ncbi:MAG: DUF4153 domain-containing protein [Eubacteriales bacterium]
MKLVGMIKDRFKSISHTWIRFPIVFVLLFIMAVYASISIETNSDQSAKIYALILGVFLSTAMTFGFEKRSNSLVWLAFSQAAAVGLAAAYYFLVLGSYTGSVVDVLRIVILSFALLFVSLWVPCLRWKTDFNDFFMTFFKAFFTTAFFIAIFWGGISLVLSAVDQLLFKLHETLFGHVAVWIWVFIAPMLFLSLIPVFGGTQEDKAKQEHLARIPGFFKVLLSYILIPLTALYTLVLLAYLVKTFVGGDPGDLLRPLILAYCIVVIVLYVLVSNVDNKVSQLFRMIFPKLMVLIALYQVVNLIIKIPGEGIVYGRYFVILFGIFSIAAGILMSLLPLKKNVILAIVLTGFALVSVTPPVDAFTISTNSQLGILDRVLTSNSMIKDGSVVPNKDLSEKDRGIITVAMQYLYDVKETDRVPGVSAKFELYNDFEKTFGFSPYYDAVYVDQPVTSFYYILDASKPVEINSYEYMMTVQAGNYDKKNRDEVVASVTDQGKTYNAAIVVKGDQIDIQLRDDSGSTILTASVNALVDSISQNAAVNQKEQLSPELMTFDVAGTGASMRIIFQNASKDESTSNTSYNATMLLLIKIG